MLRTYDKGVSWAEAIEMNLIYLSLEVPAFDDVFMDFPEAAVSKICPSPGTVPERTRR